MAVVSVSGLSSSGAQRGVQTLDQLLNQRKIPSGRFPATMGIQAGIVMDVNHGLSFFVLRIISINNHKIIAFG